MESRRNSLRMKKNQAKHFFNLSPAKSPVFEGVKVHLNPRIAFVSICNRLKERDSVIKCWKFWAWRICIFFTFGAHDLLNLRIRIFVGDEKFIMRSRNYFDGFLRSQNERIVVNPASEVNPDGVNKERPVFCLVHKFDMKDRQVLVWWFSDKDSDAEWGSCLHEIPAKPQDVF